MTYAQICVDVARAEVDRLFSYAVPPPYEAAIRQGMRVRVPFGLGNKPTLGYVMGLSGDAGDVPADKIKPVAALCEDYPVFTPETLRLAEWMRGQYYAPLAACLRTVAPTGKLPKRPAKAAPAHPSPEPLSVPGLTDEQQTAAARIIGRIDRGDTTPALLFGVTGSGKTEVYLRVIAHVLAMGKDAIVLVPEIALTPQTVALFTARFGARVGFTHSRLSPGERFRIWKQALDGDIQVMIGPRSAVFAPFKRPGVIVIDEEHEHTYQSEQSPKYVTREVAIERGRLTGAAVVMGSATPALESYLKARQGTYYLETLTRRVNNTFPRVELIDMRRELAEGNVSLFSRAFTSALTQTLQAGEQVILFLNRRGHSGFVSCRWCGHVLCCGHCRVNYTYHADGTLICHYCGHTTITPPACPACGSAYLRLFGAGTQKVEAEMAKLFPQAVCLRMDMDTTKGKHGHADILNAFRKGEGQALIGTQMIAKGLDFPRVTLVGVVAADISLYNGDFRAAEHTFQLLTQVSGRAGRAENKGRVYIQTYNPHHYSLALAQKADYESFYRHEINIREAMGYPPFSHVFSVLFTGRDERHIIQKLHLLLSVMRYCDKQKRFDLLGVSPATVSKIKEQYRWKLLLKAADAEALKRFVLYCVRKLKENDPLTGIHIGLTLNPVMME